MKKRREEKAEEEREESDGEEAIMNRYGRGISPKISGYIYEEPHMSGLDTT